jgi:hypothetical protein
MRDKLVIWRAKLAQEWRVKPQFGAQLEDFSPKFSRKKYWGEKMDGKLEVSLDKLPVKRLEAIEENGVEHFPPYVSSSPLLQLWKCGKKTVKPNYFFYLMIQIITFSLHFPEFSLLPNTMIEPILFFI